MAKTCESLAEKLTLSTQPDDEPLKYYVAEAILGIIGEYHILNVFEIKELWALLLRQKTIETVNRWAVWEERVLLIRTCCGFMAIIMAAEQFLWKIFRKSALRSYDVL